MTGYAWQKHWSNIQLSGSFNISNFSPLITNDWMVLDEEEAWMSFVRSETYVWRSCLHLSLGRACQYYNQLVYLCGAGIKAVIKLW